MNKKHESQRSEALGAPEAAEAIGIVEAAGTTEAVEAAGIVEAAGSVGATGCAGGGGGAVGPGGSGTPASPAAFEILGNAGTDAPGRTTGADTPDGAGGGSAAAPAGGAVGNFESTGNAVSTGNAEHAGGIETPGNGAAAEATPEGGGRPVASALPAVSSGSGLECILCGKCLEVCPLVRSTGREELSPKAKHYLAQVLDEDPERLSGQSVTRLAALCMACGRCCDACPRGLSAADVVARLRAEHPAFEQWLWKNWIKAGWLLWPTLASLARLAPRFLETGGGPGAKRLGDMVRKLRTMDDAQGLAPWLVVERFAPVAGTDGKGGPDGPDAVPEPVVLFTGCMAANARTRWTDAALRLLEGLGCDVALAPDWTCCGATLGHAGMPGAQEAMRRRNVAEWRTAERVRIVVFCASCLHGLRAYADADLGWEPGEAERWRAALTPLSTLFGATTFRVVGEVPERLLYHSPCHARPRDADQVWFTGLLAQLGLTDRLVAVNEDRCCGMGGIVQLGAPELSARVAADCWSALLPDRIGTAASGAVRGGAPGRAVDRATDRPTVSESSSAAASAAPAQLLTGCSGCVTQLKATAPAGVAVGHWLEIFL